MSEQRELIFGQPSGPAIKPVDGSVGKGNGIFLADLANGVPTDEIRARWKAGRYPGASLDLIKANLGFARS